MKTIMKIFSGAVAVVVSASVAMAGCGGGGGGATVTPPATTSANINYQGDSTCYGTQYWDAVLTRTSNNVPALLQQMFGGKVVVQNNCVGGADITMAYDGTQPRYSQTLAQRLAADTQSQYVVSNFGINDSANLSVGTYTTYLNNWITTVRAAGKTPIMVEPNPTCDGTHTNEAAFVAALQSVTSSQGVVLIAQYDYILSLPNWQGLLSDCIHPGDTLYRIKAQREWAVLSTIIH